MAFVLSDLLLAIWQTLIFVFFAVWIIVGILYWFLLTWRLAVKINKMLIAFNFIKPKKWSLQKKLKVSYTK